MRFVESPVARRALTDRALRWLRVRIAVVNGSLAVLGALVPAPDLQAQFISIDFTPSHGSTFLTPQINVTVTFCSVDDSFDGGGDLSPEIRSAA